MKKLVCFQLLNDYSGSPKVLKTVLDRLCNEGVEVELLTSNTHGVLDELKVHDNFEMRTYCYQFSDNALKTLVCYTWIQLLTFFMAFRYIFRKDVVFYINTLLPVGPALAGRMMGKRVIYHYHENADAKGVFYKTLAACMQRLAHKIICVSKYQSQYLRRQDLVTVIPNAIPNTLVEKLRPNPQEAFQRKNVLMLGSLREYKGASEFYQLAALLPKYLFTLVINDTQENIDMYVKEKGLTQTENLEVYSRQSDVSRFYNESSLVLNLSNKELVVETFGLTALEAMSAGLPVVVPTVGGIAEMVEDGVNGYKIDVQELDKIEVAIDSLLTDENKYKSMASNALEYSKNFSEEKMVNNIKQIIWK